jgi:branched-chain amino acid transport system permease protein
MAFITILSFWIGGSKSIAGPIIGSALITSIPTLFNVTMEWRIVICGILALLIRMFMPEGIVGLLERLGKVISRKAKGKEPAGEVEGQSVSDQ